MIPSINLDAYFQRIGYVGERTASLETLGSLSVKHAETIPFENLTPLMKQPVRLDLDSLEQKLVRDGRGGYCFEQNLLFSHVLRALGFSVTGLEARVMWANANTPRTHMLISVEIGGEAYLADVGFAGQTLTGPLRFEIGAEQTTPHEPFRLILAGDEFEMQCKIREEWKSLYQFDRQRQRQIDYEVGNWYVSTHPESKFVTELIAGRTAPDRRYGLHNNELSVHHLGGETEKRVLSSAAELRETLETEFLLRLPDSPELNVVLERFTSQS